MNTDREEAMTGLEDYQQRDIEELRRLFLADDPRGLEQMIAEDEYTDAVVEKATKHRDGYEITMDGNLGTLFLRMPEGKPIKVGDTIRFYQSGPLFGGMRHGFAVNGEVIEYETPWDRFATRMAMLARHDHERREDFTKVKPDIDRWYTMLRSPYKDRIDRFRRERADFDLNGGSYEIYPVLMAQRIEDWLRSYGWVNDVPVVEDDAALAAVRSFRDLPQEEQSTVIHGGEPDSYGISGHQFDSACGLARVVLTGGQP